MMKSRRKALVLLAALVACVVSAIIQSFDASALTSIEGVYNQSYSTLEGNLVIKDDMIPTDVILDENKVGFYYACYNHYVAKNKMTNQHPEWSGYSITFSGRTASAFDCYAKDAGSKTNLVFQGEDRGNSFTIAWDHDNSMTEGTWTYNNADDYIKIVSSEAAVDVQTGAAYDIYMIFSNINVRMYDCVKKDGDTTLASIAYGWGNNMGSSYTNLAGMSFLTGKSIEGKSRCRSGALFNVKVELHDHATGEKINGKKMIWALNDIDIGDRMNSKEGGNEYSATYNYAEHFRFLRDSDNNIRGAVDEEIDGERLRTYVSMVDILDGTEHGECNNSVRGEQELFFKNDVIYHNIYVNKNPNHCVNSENGATDDNSTSALFLVDTTDFEFEWGGSKCGTTIDSAPYSKFVGMTELWYDGSMSYNGRPINADNPITVNSATSKPIIFNHYIKREMGISTNEAEPYRIKVNDWQKKETVSGSLVFGSVTDHDYKLAYTTHNYPNSYGGYRAYLSPGQIKTYKHELEYRLSNVNNKNYVSAGERAIVLKRPPATFTGGVTPTVKNGNTNATINSSKRVKITDPDGKYTVDFAYIIARNNDTAGDTVETPWNTNLTKNGNIPSPSYEASGAANRTEGQSKGDDITGQTYTGNLRYGESITFCGNIRYKSIIDATNGDTRSTVSECVTVWRDNATCDFFPEFQYGLENASNVGRIGVNNYTLVGNQDNPTYTVPYTTPDVSIFARPGDSVRFYLQMCAGTLYPIREKNITNKTVSYKASGESTKLSGNGNGYLFRQSVSVVDGSFFNPRIWTSANDGHNYNFLRDKNLIGDFWSPNGQAEKKYRCGAVGDMENGHYQIAGKLDCGRSENPAYDIGVIDVGSTITQKLEWDEMTYANGTFDNSRNAHRVATASVVTPYNYVLKPYVTNGGGGNKVAYLGETAKMSPGVVVTARKNTAFPNGKQTYATITKPTDINVKYYFATASGSVIAEAAVSESSRSGARLNPNGSNGGTGLSDIYSSAIESGGTLLPEVDVPIPENTVHVGDKVCVEVSVYPADSHDNPNATTVLGGGNNGEALRETSNGSNWATAVSCSTIAKKPTMSVESSNAYSATEFKTAQYARNNGGKMFNFGSWSEYGVFGRVNTGTSIFVSGAALGYSRDGYPASRAANAPRANDAASADNKKVSTKTNSDKCTFMTQTFANAECNPGYSKIGGVMATQYEQRIKERYSSDAGTFSVAGLGVKSFDSVNYYDVSGYNGSDVIVEPSGILRFDSKNNLYIASLPNVSNAQFAEKGIERPNRTIVYSAPNKNIVIDGNLNYDSGAKGAIDDLTQVIIIAKNVYFTNVPTYTNAIIIAESVNTCKYATGSKVAVGGKGGAVTIDSNLCNQALRFDSPVIVKKLILNRTAGADNGENAIRRAEIFNLNMANFLWSFNQMSRLSQATTTYSRELPTRY